MQMLYLFIGGRGKIAEYPHSKVLLSLMLKFQNIIILIKFPTLYGEEVVIYFPQFDILLKNKTLQFGINNNTLNGFWRCQWQNDIDDTWALFIKTFCNNTFKVLNFYKTDILHLHYERYIWALAICGFPQWNSLYKHRSLSEP